ncbi:MAG: hypothetical protein AB7D05_03960 [Mangrovibacterium sp.]
MKKTVLSLFILAGLAVLQLSAQVPDSDNNFRRPLEDVLKSVEKRYQISLRYSPDDVTGKMLDYADWRFRSSLEITLKNVLGPFDLCAHREGKAGSYRIEPFRYHRRTVEEARETLDYLAGLSASREEWEKRRLALRKCLPEAVRLSPLPEKPVSEPIRTPLRRMKGYTVHNLALEVLPGVYVCGSLYQPARIKGKIPVVLCPNGHFGGGRYNRDVQSRCAGLARMGAVALSYDLFAWGESALQFDPETHRRSLANTMQALNSIRLLDYLLSLGYTDPDRIGITGGSGGGSHTILMTALDERIDVSVPVVMLSAIHYGGCPCESGNPVHLCAGGTNNVELAALFAPKPQLVVSDGGDWTANVPVLEFPFLKRIYQFYGEDAPLYLVHLPDEGHDYGSSKREAMYRFMARHLKLDRALLFDREDRLDESALTIEPEDSLKVFGSTGEKLPPGALRSFESLENVFLEAVKAAQSR